MDIFQVKLSDILYRVAKNEITYEEGFDMVIGLIRDGFVGVDSIEAGLSRFGVKQEK